MQSPLTADSAPPETCFGKRLACT